MRRYIAFAALACSLLSLSAQEVSRVQVGDNQNYGITYNLPSVRLHVQASAVCTTFKAGIYAQYAEKYLGLTDVPLEDAETWTITHVSMTAEAVSDTARSYHILFNAKDALPAFYLADGCLAGINKAPVFPPASEVVVPAPEPAAPELHAINVMSEELLKAGSKSKQAEIASRQIFRIRESRLNLLTGDVDNLPADGASFQLVLDNLNAQEAAYMELFTGVSTTRTVSREFSYRPDGEARIVLFRFSRHFGFVDADDLSGEPCQLQITITDDKRSVPVLLDAKGKAKPVATGIAYTVPGRAHAELVCSGSILSQGEWPMGQFGHVELLPSGQFTNKKAPASALFDVMTGGILQLSSDNSNQ